MPVLLGYGLGSKRKRGEKTMVLGGSSSSENTKVPTAPSLKPEIRRNIE